MGRRPEDHYTYNIAYKQIGQLVDDYLGHRKVVHSIEIGSKQYSGSYLIYFNRPGWSYIGMDLEPGRNVDVVSDHPYRWPFEDNQFDCLVSGQVLEHVEYPWEWMGEAHRIIKPGGLIMISVPTVFKFHEYPIDAWRFYPAGIEALFKWVGFEKLQTLMKSQRFAGKRTTFTFGVGRKRTTQNI